MRRVLETLGWEAQEWDNQGLVSVVQAASADYAEGCLAYACRQASTHRRMASKFAKLWAKVPELVAADMAESI
jgi:hypothetical protein